MSLDKFVVRAAELTGAYGNYRTAPELVDAETIAMARCTLANQELELFTRFCYQQDVNGRFINLAGNTQIPVGVWCPWGSSGKSKLTRTERDVMRKWMLSFSGERPRPLFFYASAMRRWHVNTSSWDTLTLAMAWVNRHELIPKDYLKYGGLVRRGATAK
jgi:hypothetical protein